jgi:hypothetical protein
MFSDMRGFGLIIALVIALFALLAIATRVEVRFCYAGAETSAKAWGCPLVKNRSAKSED